MTAQVESRRGPSPHDSDSIKSVILDYFEGWFDGEPSRMERALHPELSKRGVGPEGSIHPASADQMISATKDGGGSADRPVDLAIEVTIDDVYRDIATATVYSAAFVEYVHLVRATDGWRILNTLYMRRA